METNIMSPQPTCPNCGSTIVARSQEEEGYICMSCKHHFPYSKADENYKYSLDLTDYRFTEIPYWVYDRTYLKKIDLSAEPYDSFHAPFCNRIKVISPEIGLLTNLEELDLTYNDVSDIPPEIGNCKELRYLSLARNQLSDIPPEIGNLKKLEVLNLYYNFIESLPPEIGELISLSGLHADCNRIKSLPKEIGKLKNLKVLNLSNNQLVSLPKSIVNLQKLEKFDISGNKGLVSPPYNVALEGIQAVKEWFVKSKYNNGPDVQDLRGLG